MARIKVHGRSAVYHCMSRIVGGQALLDDVGKEQLVRLLWQLATFSGLEVITYCEMSYHFHVLVRVPAEQNPTDPELVQGMKVLYGKKSALVQLARKALARDGRMDADIRKAMLERMGDVSAFMKELKQRFTYWVNEMFALHREKFGAKRQSGARPIRGVSLGGLSVLRDLRIRAVT